MERKRGQKWRKMSEKYSVMTRRSILRIVTMQYSNFEAPELPAAICPVFLAFMAVALAVGFR